MSPIELQRTLSKSNKTAAKSTNPTIIPPLITVWLQVRVLPGPPKINGFCRAKELNSDLHFYRRAAR
jgi:hypothetical protein